MVKPPPLNVPTKSMPPRNAPELSRPSRPSASPKRPPLNVPAKSVPTPGGPRLNVPTKPFATSSPRPAVPPPTPHLTLGRQLTLTPQDKDSILASATFRLSTIEGTADFAELGGITSEVENTEYMDSGPFGAMFSRHAGRSKPPTIVLKRAMRTGPSTLWIWTWHQAARRSLPNMHRQAFLTFFGAGDDNSGVGRMTYALVNAWPSKVEIAGMKAGGSEVILQTITLQCDDLMDPNAI
jgi:phage tail-like protein